MNDQLARQQTRLRQPAHKEEEISLGDVIRLLWRSKLLVLGVAFGLAFAAYGVAWTFPRQYEAKILLEPVMRESGDSALSNAISQFSGLATLAGLSGANRGSTAVALATLQSRVLTERFIEENNLLPILYAKKWDARTHRWRTQNPSDIPTPWKANEYFDKAVRDISEDRKTGLVTMTITWTDPVLAADWANGLVAMTNDYMRNQAIQEANAEMAYLRVQAVKTDTVEMKTTVYTLMERELQKAMVAAGQRQFALRVIDPAVPAEKPSAPKRSLWALAGLILGFFLAASYVLAHAVRTKE